MKAYRDNDGELWVEVFPGKAILIYEELLYDDLGLTIPSGNIVPQDVTDVSAKYGPLREV